MLTEQIMRKRFEFATFQQQRLALALWNWDGRSLCETRSCGTQTIKSQLGLVARRRSSRSLEWLGCLRPHLWAWTTAEASSGPATPCGRRSTLPYIFAGTPSIGLDGRAQLHL
eukprot:s49_g86.t2